MTAGYIANHLDLEDAIYEVEGDAALIGLAIRDVFDERPEKEDGKNVFRLTDDQVRAIQHAEKHITASARALSKVFYGPKKEKPL